MDPDQTATLGAVWPRSDLDSLDVGPDLDLNYLIMMVFWKKNNLKLILKKNHQTIKNMKNFMSKHSTLISKSICIFTQINYPKKQLELNR